MPNSNAAREFHHLQELRKIQRRVELLTSELVAVVNEAQEIACDAEKPTEDWRERAAQVAEFHSSLSGYSDPSCQLAWSNACAKIALVIRGMSIEAALAQPKSDECPDCHGSGWRSRIEVDPEGHHESAMAGYSDDTKYTCDACGGTGIVAAQPTSGRKEGE